VYNFLFVCLVGIRILTGWAGGKLPTTFYVEKVDAPALFIMVMYNFSLASLKPMNSFSSYHWACLERMNFTGKM
jgi:hypothetical protein